MLNKSDGGSENWRLFAKEKGRQLPTTSILNIPSPQNTEREKQRDRRRQTEGDRERERERKKNTECSHGNKQQEKCRHVLIGR